MPQMSPLVWLLLFLMTLASLLFVINLISSSQYQVSLNQSSSDLPIKTKLFTHWLW